MKFSIKASDFISSIAPANVCARSKVKEYPDVGKLTLSVKDGAITVIANNGYVAATVKVPDGLATIDKDGDGTEITVNAVDFENTLSSFKSEEMLSIAMEGKELIVRPVSNARKMQSLPTIFKGVEIPSIAEKFPKEIKVNRQLFINSIDKVAFAIGKEDFRPDFRHLVMRFSKNKLRTVCGDGVCIVVYQIQDGDTVIDTKETQSMLIKDEQIGVLLSILKATSCEDILLQEYIRKNKDKETLMNQTVISCGDVKIVLIGHSPELQWQDENKFINRKGLVKVAVPVTEWDQELKGIMATYNSDIRKANVVHTTRLEFDFANKLITLKAEEQMRSLREVSISDSKTEDNSDSFDFCCTSKYLLEVHQNTRSADDFVQFEFSSATGAAAVKMFADEKVVDGDVVVVNENKAKEQLWFFIGRFNKK